MYHSVCYFQDDSQMKSYPSLGATCHKDDLRRHSYTTLWPYEQRWLACLPGIPVRLASG
jgi:hypothetical protein